MSADMPGLMHQSAPEKTSMRPYYSEYRITKMVHAFSPGVSVQMSLWTCLRGITVSATRRGRHQIVGSVTQEIQGPPMLGLSALYLLVLFLPLAQT